MKSHGTTLVDPVCPRGDSFKKAASTGHPDFFEHCTMYFFSNADAIEASAAFFLPLLPVDAHPPLGFISAHSF